MAIGKKITAAMLALLMAVSVCGLTAFADGSDPATPMHPETEAIQIRNNRTAARKAQRTGWNTEPTLSSMPLRLSRMQVYPRRPRSILCLTAILP